MGTAGFVLSDDQTHPTSPEFRSGDYSTSDIEYHPNNVSFLVNEERGHKTVGRD